jgi:hypothetical protein
MRQAAVKAARRVAKMLKRRAHFLLIVMFAIAATLHQDVYFNWSGTWDPLPF